MESNFYCFEWSSEACIHNVILEETTRSFPNCVTNPSDGWKNFPIKEVNLFLFWWNNNLPRDGKSKKPNCGRDTKASDGLIRFVRGTSDKSITIRCSIKKRESNFSSGPLRFDFSRNNHHKLLWSVSMRNRERKKQKPRNIHFRSSRSLIFSDFTHVLNCFVFHKFLLVRGKFIEKLLDSLAQRI